LAAAHQAHIHVEASRTFTRCGMESGGASVSLTRRDRSVRNPKFGRYASCPARILGRLGRDQIFGSRRAGFHRSCRLLMVRPIRKVPTHLRAQLSVGDRSAKKNSARTAASVCNGDPAVRFRTKTNIGGGGGASFLFFVVGMVNGLEPPPPPPTTKRDVLTICRILRGGVIPNFVPLR